MEEQNIQADILIIGGGTAGLTASIYAERAGRKAIVLEAQACGGQIVNTERIDNYPGLPGISGFDYSQKLQAQATELGAEIRLERVRSLEREGCRWIGVTRRHRYEAKAVIIAAGAVNRHLGIARENELTGSGVSYCAVCDGSFFKGKDVAVSGGGNTALEDADYLSRICHKVYLIHRRDQFRGDAANVEKLQMCDNVEFVLNCNVTELLGSPRLTGVQVTDKVTGEKRTLEVSGLFVAIGQVPQNDAFADLVDLDEGGYIIAGEDCRTKAPGIFAAGDCRTKSVRQLATAASDGAVAALAADAYISSMR